MRMLTVICTVATLLVKQTNALGKCEEHNFFRYHGYALIGHVIKSASVDGVKCTRMCSNISACFSVNVYRDKNGTPHCELNKSTKSASPEDFVIKSGCEYDELEVRGTIGALIMTLLVILVVLWG